MDFNEAFRRVVMEQCKCKKLWHAGAGNDACCGHRDSDAAAAPDGAASGRSLLNCAVAHGSIQSVVCHAHAGDACFSVSTLK